MTTVMLKLAKTNLAKSIEDYSFESDDPMELSDEYHRVYSDINRGICCMESIDHLSRVFLTDDEMTFDKAKLYHVSVESCLIANGFDDIPVAILVPSFESDKAEDFKEEAKEKKANLFQRLYAFIVRSLKSLGELLGRWIKRKKKYSKVQVEADIASIESKLDQVNPEGKTDKAFDDLVNGKDKYSYYFTRKMNGELRKPAATLREGTAYLKKVVSFTNEYMDKISKYDISDGNHVKELMAARNEDFQVPEVTGLYHTGSLKDGSLTLYNDVRTGNLRSVQCNKSDVVDGIKHLREFQSSISTELDAIFSRYRDIVKEMEKRAEAFSKKPEGASKKKKKADFAREELNAAATAQIKLMKGVNEIVKNLDLLSTKCIRLNTELLADITSNLV